MRNFSDRTSIFLAVSVVLTGLACHSALAGGEPLVQTTSSDNKSVPVEELGTGNYSRFPFHVSVSVRGGYDDNIDTSKIDRRESAFTNGNVMLSYDFGSPRTQLSLQAGGGVTYYWDDPNRDIRGFDSFDQNFDFNGYISLSLVHKVSPRLTLSSTDYITYQSEPDFTLALGLNRRSGNFFYTQDRSTATYLWTPRFATATSYTFGALAYDEDSVGFFEDRIENTWGNEFKFLIWPTTSLVAEYRFQLVTYDHDINRDSMTHFMLGGFDTTLSPRLSASFRGGAEFRSFDDNNDNGDNHNHNHFNQNNIGDETSPYFEGTVNYALGKNTSLSWNSRYAIEEPDVLLNPSRKTFRTGLRVKHDFTPRITANFGAYYQHDDYHSITNIDTFSSSFTEEAFDGAVSLRFAVTRHFGIEAGYNHTEVWSDIFLREYSRNRVWGGLNVIF